MTTDDATVYVCGLTAEEKEFAAANLNEVDDECRVRRIEEIRRWILETDGLHSRTDDFFILRFLRACKFDVQKTKWKFLNYHRQRGSIPEWFDNRDPFLPEMQDLFKMGVLLPLKKLDDEGRLVVMIRIAVHDPAKYKQSDVLKAGMMVLDVALRDHEPVTLNGLIAILDMNGVTLGHGLQLTPQIIKKLVHAWQGCYPVRICSMDFINAPMYINVVLNVFKSFMYQKLRRRVHVHSNGAKSLLKKIPADILPNEYGGTDGPVKDLIEHWKRLAEDNRDWYANDEKYVLSSPQ